MAGKKKTAKQKKVQETFKKGVKKYKDYKKENPNGKKKMQSFIKEEFKK
jgi:hypothetical protein